MNLKPEFRQALIIAGIYLVLAVCWIVFSDRFAAELIQDPKTLSQVQTWKGSLFVLATSLFLFIIVKHALHKHATAVERNLETAHRLLSASAMVPFGIFSAQEPGMLLYANDTAASVLGLPADGLSGTGWIQALHEEDRDRLRKAWGDAVAAGRNIQEEFRIVRPDGSQVSVIGTASPQFDEHGKLIHYVGTLTDVTARRAAERARDELGKRLELTVSAGNVGLWDWDLRTDQVYYSPQWKRQLGYEGEEIGSTISEWRSRVHPDELDDLERRAAVLIEKGKGSLTAEFRLRHKDGSWRWILAQAAVVAEKGVAVRFMGAHVDITDRKHVEIELESNLAHYSKLADLSPMGIYHADPDGAITYVNASLMKMVGAESSEPLLGNGWLETIHEADRGRIAESWKMAIAASSDYYQEYRLKSADGKTLSVVENARPLRDHSNRVSGYIGTVTDVTSMKETAARLRQAETLARERESRYRELFESNPVPMCVWDPESFAFLAVNDAMVEHYGYSREEFSGMSLRDIRPPEDVPRLMAARTEAMKGAYAAGIWKHVLKGGRVIEVDIHSHPVRFGERTAMLAQMTDVTAQRRAEAALEQGQVELSETTARLNHILTTSPTLVYTVRFRDGKFKPTWISHNVERIFGYTPEEALEPDWWLKHMHPDDRKRVMSQSSVFEERDSLVDEFRFYRKSGEMVWVRAESRRVGGGLDAGYDVVGAWSDITEERKTQERRRLDAAAIESTRDGVMITDLESKIISVNRALLLSSGYEEKDLLGKRPNMFQSGRHDRSFYLSMWHGLRKSGHWQGEIWNRTRSGEVYPVWLTISVVYNEGGQPTHYVAIYTDISKLKESEAELHKLAHFDPLTQLPNRLLLQSRLEHAIDQAQRRDGLVALVFLDLDDFKKVNDSLGHVVGDELLSEVARRLRVRVRDEDTLARLGGDEFVVLLESLSRPEDAANVARDLLVAIAAPFALPGGHELHVHGSIGISVCPNDGANPEELLRAADTAMYRAKDEGGDRFLFFTSEMSREVLETLKTENALRQALVKNEFTLNFQPKVHVATGRIWGAEALLRWRNAERGSVSPADFIPVAERTGLIVPIGNWVIEAACAQYAEWHGEDLAPVDIAVNVSARQFRSADFEETIKGALKKHHMPPEKLILEMTESMLVQRPEEAAAILARLKKIGVGISLDDFGTGFSSLSYLTRFPVDTLKIDKSFVQKIEADVSARQIISAIVQLAHGLGMESIAEGVETEEQESFLRELGCDSIQGFLFSKPLEPRSFAQFVRTWMTDSSVVERH